MPDTIQAVPSGPTPRTDRRAVVRFRCDPASPDRHFISDSYRCLPTRVVDLCATGIGLHLAAWVEPGTHVSIELDGGARDRRSSCRRR